MELLFKPAKNNTLPLHGFLIQSKSAKDWLIVLQKLGISLANTVVYAIPDNTPNSIWGCFVNQKIDSHNLPNSIVLCQSKEKKLFIPENCLIFPELNSSEIDRLFASNAHVFHPDFGLFEMEEAVNWSEILKISEEKNIEISMPHFSSMMPQKIRKLEIKPLPPDELLEKMSEEFFPAKEKFEDKPLSLSEKIKHQILKPLFKKSDSETKKLENKNYTFLKKLMNLLPKGKNKLDKMHQDYEDLEKRNQSEMDKLMDLFKNNPEEALKYAIPISTDGIERGGFDGSFSMNKRWSSFNIFGRSKDEGSGGVTIQDEEINRLQKQYSETAEYLIKAKNYQKAAFVYFKLLNNKYLAAQTLENGKLHAEAASIYLKHLNNKEKAANCYENGKMTSEAIKLYLELENNEKAGDLYRTINQEKNAIKQYKIVADKYEKNEQFVKVSLLFRDKINDFAAAQNYLLKGWQKQKDAFNCLNNYFANINDVEKLEFEIEKIHLQETNEHNKADFLKVLKHEVKKDVKIAQQSREIAYQIVAELGAKNTHLINELSHFNKDSQLINDIVRFKSNQIK
ncbi:MAG: hypothetical protein KA313_02530 [Pseudarcicella sp.]|nr:hypothetical protein [Pseudarcicella sp.]MBP6409955.1 hypothetical protein [Pseudarcicella sp.]